MPSLLRAIVSWAGAAPTPLSPPPRALAARSKRTASEMELVELEKANGNGHGSPCRGKPDKIVNASLIGSGLKLVR